MTDPTTGAAPEPGADAPAEPEVPEQGTLRLALDNDRAGVEDWEQATAAVLRKSRQLTEDEDDGAVWQKLTRTTLDGIGVKPLGTSADLDGLRTSGRPARAGGWDIRTHLAGNDAGALNEAALADLDGGATSLWLTTGDGSDLATLLRGVLLDLAPVVLQSTTPLTAAHALLAFADDHGVDLHPDTNLGADPLGDAVRGGGAPVAEQFAATVELAREHGILGAVVDASVVHDLGASDAQELGYSMAVGAAYLRWLTEAGLEVAEAAKLLEFRYAASDEQFPTIAKLRAARRLWDRVLELSGAEPVAQRQHAVTSRVMMTAYDPHVNMLRGTVAAFAAGVAGADAITVVPFDSTLGQPDAFGRRIARNVNHLLIDESHVAVVADPAGWSYAVEKLTDDLAVAGWAEFGRIEAAQIDGLSGIVAALADESLRARIDDVVAVREQQIATRERPITGLTEFPNLGETLPERAGDPAVGDVRGYGASFEALRATPPRSAVFLATLGPIAQHTARATFATNLLAAGGVAVESAGATEGPQELAAAYADFAATETGGGVVCLAGSEETYAAWGAQAAAALREAGATHVIIAGRPTDYADASCAMGVDALAFLNETREKLA